MSSSFVPTQAEASLVNQVFVQGDPQKLGILTGDVAVRIFGGAKLPPTVLGEIWGIADEENNGWLSRKGCAIAVRLMGWAQKGEKVSKELINKPGPTPMIEGVSAVVSHNTGMSIPRSPPPIPSLPPFTPQDKTKFQNMFAKANPTGGLLSGEQARDIFVKSKLPNEKLLQIWNLADTQDRGNLDATDFAIGMYFIQGVMSGQITVIPPSLPPGLYQQAGGGVRTHMTGNSGSFSPGPNQSAFAQNIRPQYTGQSQMLQPQSTGLAAQKPVAPTLPARPGATVNSSRIGSSVFGSQQPNGVVSQSQPQWDVTAAEKAQSDSYFDKLDANHAGYIEGDVAVPFMLESKLPGEILAQVWDLSDLNNDGRLTREGFAVAMHLIGKKLAGSELPTTLPQSLIPPSMRANGAIPASSPFQPVQQPQELPKDLFSFDDTPLASATSPPAPSFPTSIGMQSTGSHPFSVSSAADPFGASNSARDLLSDDDEQTASPPLHDQSAEIGNVQNQLNSTNRSLETTKTERQTTEQTLVNQAAQLSALQTQLSSAKAAYETETKLLAALKERFANQTADIQKTTEELIRSESDLSAVRVEKAEVEGNLLRDKEEARELHRKMIEAGQQAETLKGEVEKVKKDAKQQKGLLAIARKQLSSKEAERAKAEKELAEAKTEAESITQERTEVEAELEKITNEPPKAQGDLSIPMPVPERSASADTVTFAASQALPGSPEPSASPAPGKSNNPFERLAMSNSSPRPQSPFLPFANAPVPTPPTAMANGTAVTDKPVDEALSDDPFGFAQAFDAPAVAPQTTGRKTEDELSQEIGVATPKASPAPFSGPDELVPSTDLLASSPTTTNATDEFKTPPTTSSGFVDSPVRQNTAELTAAKFPDIESVTVSADHQMPGHFADAPHTQELETDLSSSLKEIEADDSDSSDEEDEVPLANLAKQKQKEGTGSVPSSAGPATASFDDAFGISTVPADTSSAVTADKDLFGEATTNPAAVSTSADMSTTSHVVSPTEAGVNAFDEAMGRISSSNAATAPSTTPQFSFDTAFEDNFDFGSAVGSTFPPAPTVNGNGSAVPAPTATNTNTTSASDGFEGLFTQPIPRTNSLASPAQPRAVSMFVGSPSAPAPASSQGQSGPTPGGASFDEIFSGLGSGDEPSLALNTQPSEPQSAATDRSAGRSDSPVSPPRATLVSRSMTPPPRAKSPPNSSPRNRPSTSSSKDGHHEREKKEPPPTRTSKLSLRLPFGKKKKQEAPPPPPPSHLTPPREEPDRHGSPAVEDDVEAVKQLTDMGFSRTQAVSALEKYSYDVPRALNSLLAHQ
ncbi:hypothetical protein D9758_001736 [Tetrapyrgos nigripes]|uniref:Uncharacterized protein n=1 Tax=Tetrapyrgos nigripes TaxID=182062 RepID=A0A8H5GXB9_9AGAR|nr:hypothetical protein D9758_001736 [Tetrapyrgos nigripes]